MSRNRLAVTNRLSGGRQKIVWRSPKDYRAFVTRPIIKEKEEKSEAVSNKSTPC
nr:hypothetical protein [Prevotella sp.]